jgi:hypothetical protein
MPDRLARHLQPLTERERATRGLPPQTQRPIRLKTGAWTTVLPPEHLRVGISRGVPRGLPAGYWRYTKLNPGPWFNSLTAPDFIERYKARSSIDWTHRKCSRSWSQWLAGACRYSSTTVMSSPSPLATYNVFSSVPSATHTKARVDAKVE